MLATRARVMGTSPSGWPTRRLTTVCKVMAAQAAITTTRATCPPVGTCSVARTEIGPLVQRTHATVARRRLRTARQNHTVRGHGDLPRADRNSIWSRRLDQEPQLGDSQTRCVLSRPDQVHPGYHCNGTGELADGKGVRHLNVGGQAIDAVAETFLAALSPAAVQTCLVATEELEAGYDAALEQHRRQVEQARYTALKAEHRYRAVDPENRLVARGLETDWNTALKAVADAETQLARRETTRRKS